MFGIDLAVMNGTRDNRASRPSGATSTIREGVRFKMMSMRSMPKKPSRVANFSLKSVGVDGFVKNDGGLQSSSRKAWRESGAAGNARRIPFVTRPTNSDSR